MAQASSGAMADVKVSNHLVLRPAFGRPEADFETFPFTIRPELGPKVPSLLKPAILGVRPPSLTANTNLPTNLKDGALQDGSSKFRGDVLLKSQANWCV